MLEQERIFTKRKRHTCSTCDRSYSNRQNLNRHVKYECGKPPSFKFSERHVCVTCHRSYKYRSHLNRHVKYECGKMRPFKCQHCNKAFTQSHPLKVHILTKHSYMDILQL